MVWAETGPIATSQSVSHSNLHSSKHVFLSLYFYIHTYIIISFVSHLLGSSDFSFVAFFCLLLFAFSLFAFCVLLFPHSENPFDVRRRCLFIFVFLFVFCLQIDPPFRSSADPHTQTHTHRQTSEKEKEGTFDWCRVWWSTPVLPSFVFVFFERLLRSSPWFSLPLIRILLLTGISTFPADIYIYISSFSSFLLHQGEHSSRLANQVSVYMLRIFLVFVFVFLCWYDECIVFFHHFLFRKRLCFGTVLVSDVLSSAQRWILSWCFICLYFLVAFFLVKSYIFC